MDVYYPNPQMIVAKCQVNHRKYETLNLIEEVINMRQMVKIIHGHLVQLLIINSHSHSPILILHNKNLGT